MRRLALLLLVVAALLGRAAPLEAQAAQAPDRASVARGGRPTTLTVWNHPIVVFRATVRQASPASRAAAAAERIEALPDDVRAEDIKVEPATIGDVSGVLLFARDRTLFAIVPEDLDPTAGETLESASRYAADEVRAVLRARLDQRRVPVILRGIAVSVAATAVLALVLWLVARAGERALRRLRAATHARAVPVLGRDVWPFLDALERSLVAATAWGLGSVAVYLWLTVVFHAFPYSRPWSERLGVWLVGLLQTLGTGAVQAIPGLFAVAVIFLATRFVLRLLDTLFRAVEQGALTLRGVQPDTARATRRIVAVLVWIFALTVAYEYIPGSETDAFKAVGIFTGLMVSLGSAGLVNHLMSGLVVVYSRALRPGELVQAGEVVGRVHEVGLLSTKLVTPRREEVTIPNAVLAGTTVTNYSRLTAEGGALVSTRVTIGYDQPWRQVHALLLLAAGRTPGVRAEPRPFVVQRALADFHVEYELRAHIERPEDRFRVLSDLHAQIQDAFNEFGVQIMSPAFESQPDRSVVVPKARWYASPAVRPKDGGLAGQPGD